MAMTMVFHLDHMISAKSAPEEIQTMLDLFIYFSVGIGTDGIPIWKWDPGIHLSNGLLQVSLITETIEVVLSLYHCGDVLRGVFEFYSIWQGSFSLTIPNIRDNFKYGNLY